MARISKIKPDVRRKVLIFIKLNPSDIVTVVDKPDVTIVYIKQGHCWVCARDYKPRKLADGRIKYKLATREK